MTKLLLVRHGLTAQTGRVLYGQTRGIGLDDRGLAQAEQLALRLAPLRPTAIYSSPLERCVETVQPLAAACRLTVVERDDLIEMHAGSWTGKPLARLRRTKSWGDVQQRPEAFRFPGGGESFEEARARAIGELQTIARRHRRGRVVVATHGDIVRVMLADLAGAPLERFQRIVVDTASVSVVTLERDGNPRVLLVNDTGDLGRFAPGGGTPVWEAATPSRADRRSEGNLRG
ncbi:MAG: histidine phosphatase family protein [Actinomycetota bacterium]